MTDTVNTEAEPTAGDAPKPENYYDNERIATLFGAEGEEMATALAAQRNEFQLDTKVREFVDHVHNGVPMMVRPLQVDLMRFLEDPHSIYCLLFTVPPRYDTWLERQKKSGLDTTSNFLNMMDESGGKPPLQPLAEAKALAVSTSLLALGSLQNRAIYRSNKPRTAEIELADAFPTSKLLVLGFESGWYLFELHETDQSAFGPPSPPMDGYGPYPTQGKALEVAYTHLATKQDIPGKPAVVPELELAYATACEWWGIDDENRVSAALGVMPVKRRRSDAPKPEIWVA